MDWDRLQCAEGVEALGVFANAFRVSEVQDAECVLDFLLYSARENRAQVVARVRVNRDFVPTLRERLDAVLLELTVQTLPHRTVN